MLVSKVTGQRFLLLFALCLIPDAVDKLESQRLYL
jgi:hypothetical protein